MMQFMGFPFVLVDSMPTGIGMSNDIQGIGRKGGRPVRHRTVTYSGRPPYRNFRRCDRCGDGLLRPRCRWWRNPPLSVFSKSAQISP
jgi:hypothetical protein